ncbi:MAG: hypothetical protein ACPG77_09465 [Nannocystaceae bacterium]
MLLVGLVWSSGCDDRLKRLITEASKRQEKREAWAAKAAEKQSSPEVSPEIDAALNIVARSDFKFLVRKTKGKKTEERRYNGLAFAEMLRFKTKWLGSDITDFNTWMREIGRGVFFSGKAYIVQLPDGQELEFAKWLGNELATVPTEAPTK